MKILCVEKMELGPIATNAFLLWEENGDGNAVLIDAPPFARDSVEEVLERQKIKLKSIWLTHGHWDHMGGVADFDTNELEIIGHRNDQIMFEQPGIMSTFAIPGLELKPVQITRWVEHGDYLIWKLLSTPYRQWMSFFNFYTLKHLGKKTECVWLRKEECPWKYFHL